jgi:hypothetical protein
MTAPTTEDEARWRAEFDKIGVHEVQAHLARNEYVPAQRVTAFWWLKDRQEQQDRREEATYRYVRWTFYAALAAVIVGVVGVLVTLVH